MKYSIKAAKSMARQQTNKAEPIPSVKKRGLLGLPYWVLLLLCLVIPLIVAWATLELVVWNKLPPALVGKWVVQGGSQDGATFDFSRSGNLVGKVNLGGKEGIVNARLRIDGKKLFSTTNHPQTGQEDTRVQIIRTLTAKELVLEDEQGTLLRMERAE